MPHPMFVRHVKRLEAIRAQRILDQLQVRAVPNMRDHDRRSFMDRLVEQARGVVAEVVSAAGESVIWNGTVLGTARAIKAQAAKTFGQRAVA